MFSKEMPKFLAIKHNTSTPPITDKGFKTVRGRHDRAMALRMTVVSDVQAEDDATWWDTGLSETLWVGSWRPWGRVWSVSTNWSRTHRSNCENEDERLCRNVQLFSDFLEDGNDNDGESGNDKTPLLYFIGISNYVSWIPSWLQKQESRWKRQLFWCWLGILEKEMRICCYQWT